MKYFACILLLCSRISYCQEKTIQWNHYAVLNAGIDLPDFFSEGKADEYSTFTFPNSISENIYLSIACYVPNAKFTPADLESYHDDCEHFFYSVVYDIIRKDYFVVSGYDKGGNVLYIKGIKKEKSYFEMDLHYDRKYQALFAKTLNRMSASFK